MTRKRSDLASSAEVRRVLRLANEFGVEVAALRLSGDGSITVFDARAAPQTVEGDADDALRKWEAARGNARQT